MASPAKILIVDDQPLFRAGLRLTLSRLGMHVQLHESNGSEEDFARLIPHAPFDLILLDLHLPGQHGTAYVHRLSLTFSCSPLVVLAEPQDLESLGALQPHSAYGHLPKSVTPEQLLERISGMLRPETAWAGTHRKMPRLTHRQTEVLARVCGGQSNKAIAEELQMSINTVRAHLHEVFGILGVSSRTQAAMRAKELGIV